MANTTQPLLNEKQAAEILNVSIRLLQRWRVQGGGPKFVKVGFLVRYRRGELEAWIEERTRAHTSQGAA